MDELQNSVVAGRYHAAFQHASIARCFLLPVHASSVALHAACSGN
jgi:hypothetical protein